MNPLIEKMRKARQSVVEIGGHKFTISRPTDIDAIGMRYANNKEALEGISRFVVGWDLTELDLIPGGSADEVPFDSEVFNEWIKDKPELWADLIDKVRLAYSNYTKKRESAGES